MKKSYKLEANFNTVSIEDVSFEDLLQYLDYSTEAEIGFDGEMEYLVSESELMSRMLQAEYDILAGIKVVPPQGIGSAAREPEEPPSEKQIEWARSLGMKNPEKKSKKEVWKYIQDHKGEGVKR